MSKTRDKLCYIVGAGDSEGISITEQPDDLVIAADGGYTALLDTDVSPQLAVGDFDSLSYIPCDVDVVRHPPEKDDTDTMIAISSGLERGYSNFVIYGGLGGRLDHSMANIQCLCFLSRTGNRAWLWGEGRAVTTVTNGTISFPESCEGMFSVFSQGSDCTGVYEQGVKYELNDAKLTFDYPLGVSNEFIGEKAEISVKDGTLAVMWNCTAQELEKLIRDGYC